MLAQTYFPEACKHWRQQRRMSQLDLALHAGVSQRHISYLETGRSQPSKAMVLRLAAALDLPLRERNHLLQAAGFANHFQETPITTQAMQPVQAAIDNILVHHQPLPAVVVDRHWFVVQQNQACAALFSQLAQLGIESQPANGGGRANLAYLMLSPTGLQPLVRNWAQIGPLIVQRLHTEALASGDPKAYLQATGCAEYAQISAPGQGDEAALMPILPLELGLGDKVLKLFSVIATLGTPQDITTDELRIETFYPLDVATKHFFEQLAQPKGKEKALD